MITTRVTIFCLFALVLAGCTQSTGKYAESHSQNLDAKKDTTVLLFAFIDSVAHQMEAGNYSVESLANTQKRFSEQLPLAVYRQGGAQSPDSIYVGIYMYHKEPFANTVQIYAPEIFRRNLNFEKIINRFGPIVPESNIVPRPKIPDPVWLDLSSHLKNKNAEVSLTVSARDFGTAPANPISQIEITNTKLKEMPNKELERGN
ncbi:hypothetical protein ABIB40_004040 [Pedobacter sp. UYP30]|uniref:hypothetical protein n=1 Tax=Pedobacter sp. UYP30 TaxID=1756400 RepID=UPI00339B611E